MELRGTYLGAGADPYGNDRIGLELAWLQELQQPLREVQAEPAAARALDPGVRLCLAVQDDRRLDDVPDHAVAAALHHLAGELARHQPDQDEPDELHDVPLATGL